MTTNDNDTRIALASSIGIGAVKEYVEAGRPLPDVLDLEVSLAALPRLNEWLRRAMAFKDRAEFVIESHLKSIDAKQRIYGDTAFGLKEGGWTMVPADAETLLKFLSTYVGADYTQAELDAGISRQAVYAAGVCGEHGPFDQPVMCPRCPKGTILERIVVNHTGLNKIAKKARAEVQRRLDGTSPETLRRRSEPSLTLTPAR